MDRDITTKSGFMVGLGETQQEAIQTMVDLRQAGCDILTVGQYLQPSVHHHEVVRYVEPGEFEFLGDTGRRLGFRHVLSGPLVRSSFHASETFTSA
jgi:lipoic acid synthetase